VLSSSLLQDATKINVSENQISIVPDEIGCFDKLETLNVSFNQLKSLPDSLKLVAGTLRELNLTKNALTTLPDLSTCTNLQLLWIGQNKITAAPNWLPSLVALQRLSLASNPWTALPDMSTP
jgi:Leucine-rich repeat (LRR) protein